MASLRVLETVEGFVVSSCVPAKQNPMAKNSVYETLHVNQKVQASVDVVQLA